MVVLEEGTMQRLATELLDSDLIRSVLDGFSDPAFLLDRDHRIRQVNAAWLRRFSGGPAVVGRHCHEVLHREPVACDAAGHDCPLVDCAARERSVHCLHVHAGPEHPEHHHVSVHPVRVHGGDLVGFLQTFHLLRASSAVPHPRRLVGRSPAFLALLDALRRAAGHELPVLLVGEPGTGKRLAAETLRELGERRRGPLVRLDATGLAEPAGAARPSSPPSTLAAWSDHLAAARGGTLVVHEIGDLPRPLQADLSERLGRFEHREPSRDTDPGDFRMVATTSGEATALVRSGALLGELHQRLALATIRVPALRERMEDLPLLVDSLLERIADGAPIEIAPEARELLAGFRYPGNVAELLRLLERAVLIADGTTLSPEHLRDARTPCASLPEVPRPCDAILPLAEVERRYLLWALEAFHGSRGELAGRLGVAERTLFRKLRELKSRAPAGAA